MVNDAGDQTREYIAELTEAQDRLSALGFSFEAAALAAILLVAGQQKAAVSAAIRAAGLPQPDRQKAKPPPNAPSGALTKREEQVLQLLEKGLTNREIAQRLNVGTRTVDSHVEHVLAKFNAASRTRAVAEAIRAGILPADSGEEAADVVTA